MDFAKALLLIALIVALAHCVVLGEDNHRLTDKIFRRDDIEMKRTEDQIQEVIDIVNHKRRFENDNHDLCNY